MNKKELEIFIEKLGKITQDLRQLGDPEKQRHMRARDCLYIMKAVWAIEKILEDMHLKTS